MKIYKRHIGCLDVLQKEARKDNYSLKNEYFHGVLVKYIFSHSDLYDIALLSLHFILLSLHFIVGMLILQNDSRGFQAYDDITTDGLQ